jgi:hypothetical protein
MTILTPTKPDPIAGRAKSIAARKGGDRNKHLYACARGASDDGVSLEDALAAFIPAAMLSGMDRSEAKSAIRSAYNAEKEEGTFEERYWKEIARDPKHPSYEIAMRRIYSRKPDDIKLSGLQAIAPTVEIVEFPTEEKTTPVASSSSSNVMEELLNDVRRFFLTYVHFSFPEQADAITLWTVYTHFFGAEQDFSWVPYLLATSAEPMSGKTTMLTLVDKLAFKPLRAETMSPALVGREAGGRTLLLDEIDGVYTGSRSDAEGDAASLRSILNGGFHKDGTYSKLVPVKGGAYEAHYWPTFGPKMLAGLGRTLPDAVKSRSIRLRLERKAPGTQVEKSRDRFVERISIPLRERIETFVAFAEKLPFVDELPDGLGPRDEDIWEPLISLADLANGEWPATARAAATKLCESEPYMSNGIRLLSDIRNIFETAVNPAFMSTSDIIGNSGGFNIEARGLMSVDDFGWSNWTRGLPINSNGIAKLLSEYDLKSTRQYAGSDRYGPSGYLLADLQSKWKLYLNDEVQR